MDEDYYIPKEIKAESFWGAIANIFLFQIFGFIIFQAFIFYLDNPLMLFYGSIWLLALLFFQSKVLAKIRSFLSKQSIKSATLSLRQIDDWIKFVLTLFFIIILILFYFGFYPLPKKDWDAFSLIAFFVFSWIVSSIFSIKIQETRPQTKKLKFQGSAGGGIAVGIMFILIAYFFETVSSPSDYFNFYLPGMAGLGIVMMCLTVLFLEDQIK